ncbi:ABC transporter permease subunit [Anaerocolumna sp. AGMB13025]|uniref:ABC transporter permease n=1 Tax=Anaerocolumna sp. AGMB13025 TaxID=3039116 RepID=UPI0024202B8C|nr:ABC transporter permease subunit [Anaerocolumna sp. AGMB13025]WFR56163.1 ABC transporter permease subunit [Anaerocolumna sp. AGMB13025]
MKQVKKLLSSNGIVTFVWLIGVLIIWEIGAFHIAGTKRTPENILPHFYQIIGSIFSTKPVSMGQTALQIVLSNAGATLIRAGEGFAIGAAGGFILALLMNLSGIVEKIAFPYLMIIQMIPILGMAPIVLAITRDIGSSRIIIAAILTFYPVATNTLAGFKAVEREKHDLMFLCAATKVQIYVKTLIPSSIPYFFTGLKISAPMAITASILVDTLQGDGGLGCMLSQSLKHAMSIMVFWQIVFLSAIIGILSFYLMGVAEKLLSPHKRALRRKKEES